ncbi:MAG: type II secretion system protein [Tepidisphaeraceae bacterium]
MTRPRPRAFTLIEMLATVAVLIVAMGLMVSLARHVRARSARVLTTGLLAQLDSLMRQYHKDHGSTTPGLGRDLPEVFSVLPLDRPVPDELFLQRAARRNNADFTRALRGLKRRRPGESSNELPTAQAFSELPVSIYDERTVRDAWGSPIVYLTRHHPSVGMAPDDRPFFFSAGPDGLFLTRDDNLYSYDTVDTTEDPNVPGALERQE